VNDQKELMDHNLIQKLRIFIMYPTMDVMNGDLQESIPSAKLEVLQSEGIAPHI
jgi:hypothetical protein